MRKDVVRCTLAAISGFNSLLFAGRPLDTNDAFPVDRGTFELEAAGLYVKDAGNRHFEVPLALTYGLIDRVEVGIGFGGQLEERKEITGGVDTESGIGDLVLGAKVLINEQAGFIPANAIAGEVKFPTADEDKGLGSGEFDYDLTWIASFQLNDACALHLNVGYSWMGNTDDEVFCDVLHYSAALAYALTDQFEPVIEVLAETPIEECGPTVVGISTGFSYALTDSIALDAAIGTRLVNDWPDLTATAGVTWSF